MQILRAVWQGFPPAIHTVMKTHTEKQGFVWKTGQHAPHARLPTVSATFTNQLNSYHFFQTIMLVKCCKTTCFLSFSSSTGRYFLLSFTTFYQGNWQEKPLSICALLKSFPWLISQIITLHTDIFLCRFYSQNTPAACRWSHHLLQYSQMSSCFTG